MCTYGNKEQAVLTVKYVLSRQPRFSYLIEPVTKVEFKIHILPFDSK